MNIKKIDKILENQPSFRRGQVKKALFDRGISNWDEATALPEDLREKLTQKAPLKIDAKRVKSKISDTEKASINLNDGFEIEAVLMKHQGRNTVCVSTQVGCSLCCEFCATGRMGFKRSLTAEEMIMQVYYFLKNIPKEERIDNVVFMGMGEPFLNYEEVIKAAYKLNDEKGFNIGARNISISTAGIPEKIKKFADEDLQVNLAVSLHGADDEVRSSLMPVNKKYPLENLFEAVDYYIKKTNRKVMFEYIPFDGINNRKKDIDNLTDLLLNRMHFINIIPYNPTGNLEGVSEKELQYFKNKLRQRGLNAGIRRSFGRDIESACGQLITEN